MIVTILAVPYFEMKSFLETRGPSRIANTIAIHDKTWFISVTDPDLEPLFKDSEDRIALQFHDIDGTLPSDFQPNMQFFTPEMAEKVVKFILDADAKDGEDVLIVNCMAGISRSGAIANFARLVCGIDYSSWKRQNPQVNPNVFVSKKLHQAWEKMVPTV